MGSISIVVGVHAVPWVDFHLRGNLGELTRSVLQNQGNPWNVKIKEIPVPSREDIEGTWETIVCCLAFGRAMLDMSRPLYKQSWDLYTEYVLRCVCFPEKCYERLCKFALKALKFFWQFTTVLQVSSVLCQDVRDWLKLQKINFSSPHVHPSMCFKMSNQCYFKNFQLNRCEQLQTEVWSNWRSHNARSEQSWAALGCQDKLDAGVGCQDVSQTFRNWLCYIMSIIIYNYNIILYILYISMFIYVSTGWNRWQASSARPKRFPLVHCVGKRSAVELALTRRLHPAMTKLKPDRPVPDRCAVQSGDKMIW